MLQGVVKKLCIQKTLQQLLLEKFSSDSLSALGWVWKDIFWSDAQYLLSVRKPVARYIEIVQGDTVSQGAAVEEFFHVREVLKANNANLPQALRIKIEGILENREAWVFSDFGLLSNLLDSRNGFHTPESTLQQKVHRFFLFLWKRFRG